MNNRGKELEDIFYKQFNALNLKFETSGKPLLIKAYRSKLESGRIPFDFTINIGDSIIAIVEIKPQIFFKTFDFTSIESYAGANDIRFYVLTDGSNFIVTDQKKGIRSTDINFTKFVNIIIERKVINIDETKKTIADLFLKLITKSNFKSLKANKNEISISILNQLNYDEINEKFYFSNFDDIGNIENKFFRLLLDDGKPIKRVYRYTTLKAIYDCLKNNTYRINCLIGMNDTTEVNYVENKIFGINKDYATANWKRVENYNNRFISSCSIKKDDLTQWRLYSEDSKGVCLELKVQTGEMPDNFFLGKISYGKRGDVHPELDFIRDIFNQLKDAEIDFSFKTLNIWKHFFKPHDFAEEKEVRLLFIRDNSMAIPEKGWVLTNSHQILNPYVDFKLNDSNFPLRLTKIVLGPKCPENKINKKQFQQYIRELRPLADRDLNDLEVGISSINSYR
jgi:hypothetical protein